MNNSKLNNRAPNIDHIFYRNLRKFYPTVDRGEGIYIWDVEGNRYIDGSGGACVVSIGHGVKEVQQAISQQLDRIAFSHGSHFTSDAALECAKAIHDNCSPLVGNHVQYTDDFMR